MITRRVLVNLIAFLVIAGFFIAYGLITILHNPFAQRTEVSTVLPSTAGLVKDLSVTSNGVQVGTIQSVSLVPKGVKVTMQLFPGAQVPGNVMSSVVRANPLGEQSVDLVPPTSGALAPPLANGAVVPAQPGGVPPDVGQVIQIADRLLNAIPKADLATVVHQLALTLDGRAGDLRTLINAGNTFNREFLAYQSQFKALLANSPPVLDTVASAGSRLRQALANTVILSAVLAQHRYDLVSLFNNGGYLGQILSPFVAAERPNAACLLHDLAGVSANVAQTSNLANLNATLVTNHIFFGDVDLVSPFGTSKDVGPGTTANDHQAFLRVLTMLPPAMPPASPYNPHRPPPLTLPGAACLSDFGPGVAAVSQANPAPPSPGGGVVPPTPAEAAVPGRGLYGGVRAGGAGASAGFDGPAHFAWGMGVAGVMTLAAALALGLASPSTRRRRAAGWARMVGRRWTKVLLGGDGGSG